MMDDWAQVDVPANHSVMVSFVRVDIEQDYVGNCGFDSLTVYIGKRKGSTNVNREKSNNATTLVLCNGSPIPENTVYHTDVLSFHFVSDDKQDRSGFKLLFSFHPDSAIPAKTASGKWNCSLAHWPQFQMHFPCNMVEECDGGEDEANCPYRNKDCGRGHFSVGGGCYALHVANRPITWNEAANECLRRGEYLASLNNPEEWQDVITFLREYLTRKVYLGMHMSGANFPEL